MESELRRHLSTFSNSTAKMLTWLPTLSLFSLSNDGQDPATVEAHVLPGSLRDAHNATCAWFLGPKAENAEHFQMLVQTILEDFTQCRRNFAPEDKVSRLLSPS